MPAPLGQRLSYGQVEQLWIQAGGPKRLAPLMAAIATAESQRYPGARNPSGATGLFQILGLPNGMPANSNLLDPEVNARAAVLKWRQQGLGAWVTYTSGAYKQYLLRGIRPQPVAGEAISSYRNPFRSVKGLTAERIDMGVDYSGQGPLYALAPGVITQADHSWAGGYGAVGPGTFITERITQGPLKGRYWYYAENIAGEVRPGQKVTTGTVLGQMTGGIETGLAVGPAAPSTTLAAQAGQVGHPDPGSVSSAYGVAASKILHDTGAPAGVEQGSGPVGVIAGWLQTALGAISPAYAAGQAVGGASGIGGAINNFTATISGLGTAIDWLVQPENWVRIIAGVAGGVLVLGGIFTLSHVGGGIDVPVVGEVKAPAALPVGILEVGAGGVLLFVAFHNLGAANVGELFGQLRTSAQQGAGQ